MCGRVKWGGLNRHTCKCGLYPLNPNVSVFLKSQDEARIPPSPAIYQYFVCLDTYHVTDDHILERDFRGPCPA